MPDYSKGKTYFIWDRTAPVRKLYIGSTVSKLKHRLNQHEYEFKHQCGKCESHRLIAMGNYEIELLENYPCENKQQLEDREAYYILTNWDSCVNKSVPGAFRRAGSKQKYHKKYHQEHKAEKSAYNKQYNQQNREKIAAKQKQYKQQNAEKIAEYKKQKIECNLCGSMSTTNNIAQHRKSKKCREAVKSQVKDVLNDMINQIS